MGNYSKKILLVEDSTISRLLIKKMLTSLGHDVATAENGLDALYKFQNTTYDIIFLDIDLPDMSGYDVAISMNESKSTATHIVAISALNTPVHREKCQNLGISDSISKPITKQSLLEIINKNTDINLQHQTVNHNNTNTIIDINCLLNDFENNSPYVEEVIGYFIEDNRINIENLRASIQTNDKKKKLMTLHKIIGSSRNIRAISLARVADRIYSTLNSCGTISLSDYSDLQAETIRLETHLAENFALKIQNTVK
ncbi:MAG: response regulator [Halodesulfovibrio sp.]